MALGAGIDPRRAGEMLAQVGLTEVADKRVGGYSLGMRQRLGLAAALLGDPPVLILDEPANGLDPAGIAWLREFLRALAAEGRTVLISSHVLSEVQRTVDEVVVLARGRLVRQGRLADLDSGPAATYSCAPPSPRSCATRWPPRRSPSPRTAVGRLRVGGGTTEQVGHAAYVAGVELHELVAEASHLERTFLELTEGDRTP